MFRPRWSLASTLLLVLVGACSLSACLLSQEDRVLDIPPPRNRPPRIMEELPITPENRVTVIPQGECPTLQFSFKAEDPEVGDTLFVNWYIDYSLGTGDAQVQMLSPTGQTVRFLNNPFSLNLRGTLDTPFRYLQQPGTHVVEALLFDGFLDARRQPLPITPATDGGIENPSYVVSYAWVVEVLSACP